MSVALEVLQPQQQTQPKVYSFAPTNFAEALKFADLLATSDIVPKQYKGKPADILVAMQYGAELGLQPLQALNSIAVINGRPGLFGDGFLGVILSQPDCQDVEEDDLPAIQASGKATCTIRRKGRKPVTRTFTLEMAQKAGLTTKDGPWKAYTSRQLQMRARGFAGRDAYADVLRGIKSVEELMDYDEAHTIEGNVTAQAQPDPIITQDRAREFGKAWKATGKTIEQAKEFLKTAFGIDSSLKITTGQYDRAMAWAKNEQPAPAEQNGNGNAEPHDKKLVFELFGILRYDDVQRAQAVKDHTVHGASTDWKTLALDLEKLLPVEG
jgi:hypothetical protein